MGNPNAKIKNLVVFEEEYFQEWRYNASSDEYTNYSINIENRFIDLFDDEDEKNRKEKFNKLRDLFIKNGFLNGNKIRFVGVIFDEFDNVPVNIYCLPKYMKNMEQRDLKIEEIMPTLLEIIKITDHMVDFLVDNESFNPDILHVQRAKIKQLELANWIVSDYCNYGIYSLKISKNTNIRKGRIDWTKTISTHRPIQVKKDIVYPELIYTSKYKDYDNLITQIHYCVVAKAIEYLNSLGYNIHVEIPEYDKWLSENLTKYVQVIHKYQRIAYYNRDIYLLRAIEAWCKDSKYYDIPYGTVSYNLVWEDCIRKAFGHPKIGKHRFGNPIYSLLYENGKPYIDKKLNNNKEPDVINIWKDMNEDFKSLLIDAKYYLGEIDNDKIKDVPDYNNIAKQIDYFDTLIKRYKLKRENCFNLFMLPKWEKLHIWKPGSNELYEYIGYVTKGTGIEKDPIWEIIGEEPSNNENNIIYLFQINPDKLYRIVLDNIETESQSIDTRCRKLFDCIKAKEEEIKVIL